MTTQQAWEKVIMVRDDIVAIHCQEEEPLMVQVHTKMVEKLDEVLEYLIEQGATGDIS